MQNLQATYIHIGKVASLSGVQGEIMLVHSLGKKCNFKNVRAIFLEMEPESFIPYFVEYSKTLSSSETIVKFDELKSREDAKLLVQKNAFLLEDDFQKNAGDKAPVTLIGYTVLFKGKVLGKVEKVIEQKHQALLSVNKSGKEILIPLHEESLIQANREKKELHVDLPEGFLDIFLEA